MPWQLDVLIIWDVKWTNLGVLLRSTLYKWSTIVLLEFTKRASYKKQYFAADTDRGSSFQIWHCWPKLTVLINCTDSAGLPVWLPSSRNPDSSSRLSWLFRSSFPFPVHRYHRKSMAQVCRSTQARQSVRRRTDWCAYIWSSQVYI